MGISSAHLEYPNTTGADVDPELADPIYLPEPKFTPTRISPVYDGARTPEAGFDTSARYLGAFEPGAVDWTTGWTAYPEN